MVVHQLLPFILLASTVCTAACGNPFANPLAGRWEGAIERDGARLATVIDIVATRDSVYGPLVLSDGVNTGTRVSGVRHDLRRVSWTAVGAGGWSQFTGELRGDTLQGEVRIGIQRARMRLVRAGAVPDPAYREESVRFAGGDDDVTLAATLLVPSGAGRHPAVVLLGGSGPGPRSVLRPFADAFARAGIAALMYDKRGDGESSGDWRTSAFIALASDARAAIRWLHGRPDVDTGRIGLWGVSEGAYLVPATAAWPAANRAVDGARGPTAPAGPWDREASAGDGAVEGVVGRTREGGVVHVDWIVLMSAALVPPAEQDLVRVSREMRAQGFDDAAIAQALALRRAAHDYISTGRGRAELAEMRERHAGARWFHDPAIGIAPIDEDPWWRWYRSKLDFDPVPLWARLDVPVLAVWGGADLVVDADRNARLLERALPDDGTRDLTIRILPGADHGLQLPAGHRADTGGRWDWHRFGPGAMDTMIAWARARVAALKTNTASPKTTQRHARPRHTSENHSRHDHITSRLRRGRHPSADHAPHRRRPQHLRRPPRMPRFARSRPARSADPAARRGSISLHRRSRAVRA